jgi:glycosyltransferase involved in cell wall biosynthesis
MPRSLMPAIAVLTAGGGKLRPIIFDSDGLAADERVDVAGLSPTSLTYRILRDAEAQMVRRSEAILVRSQAAANILQVRAGPPLRADRFFTVTNGRDEALFNPGTDESRGLTRAEIGVSPTDPLIVYAGSVGAQYRFDQVAIFAREVRRRAENTQLLILTGSPANAREEIAVLEPSLLNCTRFMRVDPDAVPRYLAAADIGLAFRTPAFSMQGVAPVKLAEYLLCGLPVIGTVGIGETRPALDAGIFFDDRGSPQEAAEWLLFNVRTRREQMRKLARAVGAERFSLQRSVGDYLKALRSLS